MLLDLSTLAPHNTTNFSGYCLASCARATLNDDLVLEIVDNAYRLVGTTCIVPSEGMLFLQDRSEKVIIEC